MGLWSMTMKRIAVLAAVAVLLINGAVAGCSDDVPSVTETAGDESPPAGLVEPPASVGNTPAATLLWSMYPDTDERTLCREDVETGVEGVYIVHGVSSAADMPAELRALWESVIDPEAEHRYQWFGSRRITVLEQEWEVRGDGREGPRASVVVFALLYNADDESKAWIISDGATVYRCPDSTDDEL